MAFYWVNLGTSYKEVAEYKFLWAPAYTLKEDGRKIVDAGWKYVPKVKKNDVIFCHEDGRVIYIAVASADAFESDRPKNRAYDQWKKEGFRIEVELEVLDIPISTEDFKETLIRIHNHRCSPKLFDVNGNATQNYMVSIPDGAGALLLDEIGQASITINYAITGNASSVVSSKATQREAIVKARVGQGQFRNDVLELWGEKCPLTGVDLPELLVASHIVSWQLSNDKEKLDKFNGLPLSPAADKLFDKGYISFSNEGLLLVSRHISAEVIIALGIDPSSQIAGLHKSNLPYLERHRVNFGFK